MSLAIGARVRIKRDQNGLMFTPKAPGRTGVVTRPNTCDPDNYLYVHLDATARSEAREDLFPIKLLEPIMTQQLNPFQHIKLANLAPSPTNPRKYFDPADLDDLASTIRDHGVIEPIIVRLWPDDYDTPDGRDDRPLYEIIAGERRYRASAIAGQEDIPALVRHLDTRQVLEVQIIENLQRRGVNELEEAEGYDLMMRDFGYTADQLAEKVGKSRAYIYGRLKLCALCDEARHAFRGGTLDASRALLIARIPGGTLQTKALKEITEGWQGVMSYRGAAQYIQNHYMRGLSHAIFALDDATLHPKAGPCTTCLKRPCNAPELYPDVPEARAADVCTDLDCMATKRDAHLQRQADQAYATGRTVVRGVDWSKFVNDYSKLDDDDDGQEETIPLDEDGNDLPPEHTEEDGGFRVPTIREMLERTGAQVEIVMVEHPSTHELVECVRMADYRIAVPAQIPDEREDNASNRPSSEAIKAESARRREIFTAIRTHYDAATDTWAKKAAVLRIIALQFWARSWPNARETAAELNGISLDTHGSIAAWLDVASAGEMIPLLLDLALVPTTDVPSYAYHADDIATPAPLLTMARAFGIDPDNPSAAPASSAKTTPTPQEAPPGGEDSVPSFAVGDRVRVRAGACFENGAPINAGDEAGVIREPAAGGYAVVFDSGVVRTYLPATALERADDPKGSERASTPTQAAPPAASTARKPRAKTASPAKKAAPARAAKGNAKAASAAKKPKAKAKSSGRASPAGGKTRDTEDDPPVVRCDKTLDLLEGVE